MAKKSTVFVCQQCDEQHPTWQGQCNSCGEWNSLVEEVYEHASTSSARSGVRSGRGLSEKKKREITDRESVVVSFSRVKRVKRSKRRFHTTISELDRVLGGGLVAGSVVLIGGEPGIGKSTVLTQMVLGMLIHPEVFSSEGLSFTNGSKTTSNSKFDDSSEYVGKKTQKKARIDKNPKTETKKPKILYISGEESPNQIGLRINRIVDNESFIYSQSKGYVSGETETANKKQTKKVSSSQKKQVSSLVDDQLLFVTTTDVDEIITIIHEEKPSMIIVDSIQTLSTQDLTGASGSVGQLRESTGRIVTVVKAYNIPTFLVGHVTKDGAIAGPKVLEHIVDAVLEITGERTGQLRLIRTLKNRFGATDEVGVFKMVEYGMREVTNPSEIFLEHHDKPSPGSATVCVVEGTRPLLLEVQALVVPSQLAMPRRVGRGIELSRIQVLSAVLQKHGGLPLGSTDIFLSAAGGFKIKEPAVDLGLAMAVASSLKNKNLPKQTVFIGEIGLLGEIRSVPYLERRIKEAKRLGFKNIVSKQTHGRVQELLKGMGL